ncbi:helix-turn-helix transcriptional regulator [Deinococcus sp. Leaf326]|uniref:helix-turn-helix domain-containing protein n=1 Tax=Deinococcus sp. Leaf326 TaxID=1736338 RepID=UPI0006F3E8AC|nr:helix-turn-helix transcriptional regulator [Deinococcus sp. Leaf326]KQR15491.1 hypothetical protein ASF71_20380 [Deinococcus sp. Leaf326]
MNRYDELSLQTVDCPGTPVLNREWLRLVRERQGLRQVDVAAGLAALGPHVALTRAQLSKLESGKLSLSFVGLLQAEGLRQVLKISQTEWAERMPLVAVPLQRRSSP